MPHRRPLLAITITRNNNHAPPDITTSHTQQPLVFTNPPMQTQLQMQPRQPPFHYEALCQGERPQQPPPTIATIKITTYNSNHSQQQSGKQSATTSKQPPTMEPMVCRLPQRRVELRAARRSSTINLSAALLRAGGVIPRPYYHLQVGGILPRRWRRLHGWGRRQLASKIYLLAAC